MLGNVWLIAALLVSVLLPLGQWYCREKADRLEGTHNRRRKERNDNLKIETDQDLTFLVCKPGISMSGLHALFFVDYSRYIVSF